MKAWTASREQICVRAGDLKELASSWGVVYTNHLPTTLQKANLCVRKYHKCSEISEKSPSEKHTITSDRNYNNTIGSSKRANEKTEHSILPKIQKWQPFHLQRNNFILFHETFAYGSN